MSDLLVRQLMRDYTAITPTIIDEHPDAQNVWLKVGAQSFCVTPDSTETTDDAVMVQRMLAIALSEIISEH